LLANGKVLISGGDTNHGLGYLASTELYDPASGTWTANTPLNAACSGHTATLLANEEVLVAGGNLTTGATGAELYDAGLGFSNSWRPQISTISYPFILGSNLTITGSQFRGVSEGSSGGTQDSSADYPLVQLRSLANDQTQFLLSKNWSANSFASAPVSNFPAGYALATAFVNGIPSSSSILEISIPPPFSVNAAMPPGGMCQLSFTNTPGASFSVLASTNLTTPLTNWMTLGAATDSPSSPGQYQFADAQATNSPQRFYRICWP
jgi:hypothetical protein